MKSDPVQPTTTVFQFAGFELDTAACELRTNGKPVRLERRPLDLLILLLERPRELVMRDDIVKRLWGDHVFVEVEMGINTAIRKVRQALGDPSDAPVFIETVPGRGYRFIAPVRVRPAAKITPARVRVAVLPFENLGSDTEREYLADGLTEETIAALGQLDTEYLSVVGRTSVMGYKRTTRSLNLIGRELNADYLVESSIRAEGGRLRITSKLIRASDEEQVWSASYDSEPISMLELQRELGAVIAEQIQRRLSPERLAALMRRQTRNPEAYDLYLRGRHLWNQLTPPTTRRALDFYSRATEQDSHYALAWSGLADAYAASPITGDAPAMDAWRRAREAATHAIESGPEMPETHATMAFVQFWFDWDWPAAERGFRKSLSLDPNHTFAHRMLGVLLSHMGRHQEARIEIRRARELDLYAMHHALSAMVELHARDFPAAIQFARQATVIDPGFWVGHYQLGQAYEQLGENELALETLNVAGRLVGGNSKVMGLRGYIHGKLGRHAEAREILETLDGLSRERYFPPYAKALVLAGLGRWDEVCGELERAADLRDVHLIFLPVDPKWDALRTNVRFRSLLDRCGLLQQPARHQV